MGTNQVMLGAAEAGNEVAKAEFEAVVPGLRVDLLNAQFELRSRDFALLIHVAGDDRQGVERAFDLLHEWLDVRYIDSHAFSLASDEELERPRFWRYWRALPAHGRTGVFLGAWTAGLLADTLREDFDDHRFERRVTHIRAFESDLVNDGMLILKFWLHAPRRIFEKRLRRARKFPNELHHVGERDLEFYDKLILSVERYLRETSTAAAPWTIVESTDWRHSSLTIGRAIREALVRRLAAPPVVFRAAAPARRAEPVLESIDTSKHLERAEYRQQLEELQARLYRLSLRARKQKRTTVLVFEGWDAAGKGGAIRRVTTAMSARNYNVVPISAPTEEERAHHYLWRFWRHLPRAGKMLIFDRSWYGRVLVERVEGYATPEQWGRAYDEINEFEAHLIEYGVVLLKFWLHVDEDEQMRRFRERAETDYKKYKLTGEDYRNRMKRSEYEVAADEMIARTSTEIAPWHLVPANDKRYARVAVLRRVCDALNA